MKKNKEVFYNHRSFSNLTKDELDLYLDFLGKVMFNLEGFDVWEIENIYSKEDAAKWDREVIERYQDLIKEKTELEHKIYGNY